MFITATLTGSYNPVYINPATVKYMKAHKPKSNTIVPEDGELYTEIAIIDGNTITVVESPETFCQYSKILHVDYIH